MWPNGQSTVESAQRGPVGGLAGSICCVLGQNPFLPHCLFPPRSINWYWKISRRPVEMLGGKLASHPEGSSDTPNHLMLRKLG